MLSNFEGRADTPAKKREVTQRLLRAWQRVPELRLGQLVLCAIRDDLFDLEDFALIEAIEAFVDNQQAQESPRGNFETALLATRSQEAMDQEGCP